jgi:hypothetical protein
MKPASMKDSTAMSEIIDLKTVKIKIYRTILEDGLLEIMMGIYFILSVFYINNQSFILHYLWLPIGLVLIEVIRRRIIFPRSGYAKISLSAGEIGTIFGIIIIGVAILTALIAVIAAGIGLPIVKNWREIISYALIFFLVISFCFIGYRFKLSRWFLHGISIGLVLLLSKVFDIDEFVFILGIWVTLVGLIVLVRYIRQFPVEPNHTLDHEIPSEDGKKPEVPNASQSR